MITFYVVVTRYLTRRNMRCDNYYPRSREPEESVTHTVFEYPPALQAGPYQQLRLVQILSHYEAFMPIWISSSGGKTVLLNQN